MNVRDFQRAAEEAASLMRSLASEKRLMILCQLADGEKSVGEIARTLGMTQPNASQQLAVLRADGLVRTRRDGQTIFYSLAGEAARRVIEVLYELFCPPPVGVATGRGRAHASSELRPPPGA